MFSPRRVVLSATIVLSVATCIARADDNIKPAPDAIIAYKTVEQADGSSDELDLNVFHPPGYQATGKIPCIVFFFGGGWNGGTPSQFYPHCEYLASRGMVAISAEYRTKKSHNVTPKTCVFDGKSAIRWVRENAADLGIDPDRVAVGGGSAGGHVAAAVAACQKLEESDKVASNCVPNALVLFNPVYDNGPDGYGHDRVKDYWQIFSPAHNLHEKMPPTIAFFGTKDKLIPVATTENFQREMEKVGVRYENHLYEGQGHGFFNFTAKKSDTNYFVETVRESDIFLKSLGFLKGEPTIEKFVKR
ncbi:Carboxylesterase NlhH [Planctomycetes bacterium CA13]|uniref:Carboxylesterase NlhH n=2 Tax=Novipirellula herctigrandis TaxID=2527986 RepID=A0A5C5ZCD2_9BACT|nr:Carboxylesterase NlhH [Planctomycetes bacterium CA13]